MNLPQNHINELMMLSEEAIKLGRKFSLGTHVLTPYNLKEEKEKFLKSDTYNPQFLYVNTKPIDIDIPLIEIRHKLNRSKLPADIQLYFHEYLNDLKVHEEAIRTIGTDSFPYYAGKLFDWDLGNIDKIKSSLNGDIELINDVQKTYNAEQMRVIFQNYLENILKIDDVLIHIDAFNDHIVRVAKGMLIIGKRVKRNEANVKRLKVHEIESHLLQHYNLRRTNNPFLKLVKQYEFMLYAEGLAVYNEVITKTITPSAQQIYIERLKGVKMIDKSFREIYEATKDKIGEKRAFVLTLRIKRGMGNTSRPGGFPKDAAYIIGYNKIKEFISEGGEIRDLYQTRVPSINRIVKKYELTLFNYVKLPTFSEEVYPKRK